MKTPLAIVLSLVAAAGIVAANQLSAQTTTTSPAATSPTTAPATATLGVATVQNVVDNGNLMGDLLPGNRKVHARRPNGVHELHQASLRDALVVQA